LRLFSPTESKSHRHAETEHPRSAGGSRCATPRCAHHGLTGVKKLVRVGKVIELETDGNLDQAALHEVCRDLLSNPVIEDYHLVVE
jgi:hypothetical protein